MNETNVTRRRVLRNLLVSGFGCVLLGAGGSYFLSNSKHKIVVLLRGHPHVAQIGRMYLKIAQGERNLAYLENVLETESPEFERNMQGRIRDEYRAGLTLTIDGWVIARTEARLSAAFYLLAAA